MSLTAVGRSGWSRLSLYYPRRSRHFATPAGEGPQEVGRKTLTPLILAVAPLAAVVSLSAAADDPGDAVRRERQRLAGTWQATSYARDGRPAPAEDLKPVTLVIDAGGRATLRREGRVLLAAQTRIDPSKAPRQIDITYTEGELKGQTALGIYEVDSDPLRLCRADPSKGRPAKFASDAGSGHALMTYTRVKAR